MARFDPPPDARVFLGRLTRLHPGAVVRLRPAPAAAGGAGGRLAIWARLPWGVLVTREVAAQAPGDVTVGAAALLGADGALPPRRDAQWRWPLPPHPGTVVEEIPAHQVREVAAAAAGTLREVTETGLDGKPVGVRVLREALLDHPAIVVEVDPQGAPARVEVPLRLVQAVVQMGFLGPAEETGPAPGGHHDARAGAPAAADDRPGGMVRVRRSQRWVGLSARYGTAWLPPASGPLTVRPSRPD